MSFLARSLIMIAGRGAAKRFDDATRDPAGTQHAKLMEILQRNKDTEYGKKYGFGDIRSMADYRKRVPIVSYEDVRPFMDRITRGESNVLIAETPVMFNQTSGTTGDAKYIPVTPTCQGRDHSDQMRTWMYHAFKTHPGASKGKIVAIVSPAIEGETPSGIPYGSASGAIYAGMPGVVKAQYAIPYEVFLIEDYEAKYYTLMRIAVAENVTMIGTANPSSVIKMCEVADANADYIITDITHGTIRGDIKIDRTLREKIEAHLRPNPKLAHELAEKRRARGLKLLPVDYWPNLALIGCWKGGTVISYLKKFPEWFDPDGRGMVPIRDWGLLASEARSSIPLTDEGSAGVLTVSTNVFEFAEVDEVESGTDPAEWDIKGVEQLEEGKEYYIFYTTTGGLYRYDINDVVKVVGRYNATPTIVFVRKGRGMTNITGEKLAVDQLIHAFESAAEAGMVAKHYVAQPDMQRSLYVIKVESPDLPEDRRVDLLKHIDSDLAKRNIEWDGKRKSGRLRAPVLEVMKPGWYDRSKQALVAEGKRLFQAKTVLLDSKKGYVPEPDETEATVTME
jgi:hypothetical protein